MHCSAEAVAFFVAGSQLASVFIMLSCGNIYFGTSFLGGELSCFWSLITLVTHHLSLLLLVCKLLVFYCIFS